MNPFTQYLLVFLVGTIAGVFNVLAGGGSLLTLPVLIFMGLPAAVANATNRLGILTQNLTAIASFSKKRVLDFRLGTLVVLPSLVGGYLGALYATQINDALFHKLLAVIMVVCVVISIKRPKTLWGIEKLSSRMRLVLTLILFFFIGIYGGFVQAGVGYFIIIALTLLQNLDLVKTNAIKVYVVFFFTAVAMIPFIRANLIHWPLALCLALGNSVGALLGAHLAVTRSQVWLQKVLLFSVIVFAIKLLFFS